MQLAGWPRPMSHTRAYLDVPWFIYCAAVVEYGKVKRISDYFVYKDTATTIINEARQDGIIEGDMFVLRKLSRPEYE